MNATRVPIAAVKWGADGLIAAVAQDHETGRVLMLAWMNAEALEATLATGYATYWSRSRQSLWKKGASSGALQRVVDVRLDCDRDAVLMRVEQGPPGACHTDRESCFFDTPEGTPRESCADPEGILARLGRTIAARAEASDPGSSYTARLLSTGPAKIAAKVVEEGGELAEALQNETPDRVVSEAADVVYHLMVGLQARGVGWTEVANELARRFGLSGLDEKAGRGKGG